MKKSIEFAGLNSFARSFGESVAVLKLFSCSFSVKRKFAFTMAEALIVIAVIGVVAAITMPVLNRELSMKLDSEREANIALKVTKAMENMAVAGEFGRFDSTEDFVNVLQKYLKITKRCSADKLNECWPSDYITDASGQKISVNQATKGEDLHIKGNTTDNVGLILADGASIILTYNQDFTGFAPDTFYKPIKKSLPIGFGKSKEFPYYRSTVTEPIDFVMDVNGSSAPNQETENNGTLHDIRSFRGASFSSGPCPEGATKLVDGKCIQIVESYDPINCENEFIDVEYKSYCKGNKKVDYYSASVKACDDIGMSVLEDNVTYFNHLIEAGILPLSANSYQNTHFSGRSCHGGFTWCYNNTNALRPIICEK